VLGADGKLSEQFIGIANLESKDPAEIRKGYERVIRPRFADAKFFFDEDLKQPLDAWMTGLAKVTYQQKLGSYADRGARIARLAGIIAGMLGSDSLQATRAASLAKCDLLSRMVGEFPELQGIMGRHYALASGEDAVVANAIDEAYAPRFSGDAIAASSLGRLLAVADRLDTIAGGFAAGLKPSGNKDPFALRRNAQGLARTLVEGKMDLDLGALLDDANAGLPRELTWAPSTELYDFVLDRLRAYYAEQGVPGTQFDAVADVRPASLVDFDQRLKAIAEFARLREASSLAAANKRIRNILRKVEGGISPVVEADLLAEPAEQALHAALVTALADTGPMLGQRDYVGTLKRLAQLQGPVDNFFERVMVMADDAAVRDNRLALLKQVADRFAAVAAVEQLSAG
jgi:glycyl-tRNA synthetase beta chain